VRARSIASRPRSRRRSKSAATPRKFPAQRFAPTPILPFGEPAAYKLMFDLTQPDESLYPDLVKANARARAIMTDNIRLMVDKGIFEGDPELIGHVLWASLHGAIVLKLAGKLSNDVDFDRISSEAFRVLSAAYRPKTN
jgi:hypothetical protein